MKIHYDPNQVDEANRKLRLLEIARTTLLNPVKRADYDVRIGQSSVGGLADPNARAAPGNVFATPPAPRPPMPSQSSFPPMTVQRVDAWVCPKCQTPNPIGTRFCKNCSQSLGIECPSCRKLTEAAAKFCAECGVNIKETQKKKEDEIIQERIRYNQKRTWDLQEQINFHQSIIDGIHHWMNSPTFSIMNSQDKRVAAECAQYNLRGGYILFCSLITLMIIVSAIITPTSNCTGLILITISITVTLYFYMSYRNSKEKIINVINNHEREINRLNHEMYSVQFDY